MKNWKTLLLTVVPATLAVSFTAFAGQWSQDMNGWRYENDDGSYCRNGWYWLDGNQDGIAECYIFDNDGYAQVSLYNLTAKAGGYEVNDQGAWVVDGVVQEKKVEVPAAEIQPVNNWADILAAYQAVNPAVSGSLAESSAYVAGNNLLIVAKNRFFLTLLKNKENALSLRETVKQFLGAEYNIRAKCSEPEEQTSKAQNLLQKAMDSHLDTAVEE